MLPYLLIATGAYLVGQSRKNEKFAKGGETHGFKFLDGGDGVEYEIWEKDGVRYRVPIERDEDVEGEYEELIIHRYFEDAEPMDMADGGEISEMRKKIAQMNIILNTSSGQVYVGGTKNKNKLFKDENGYYLVEGYWKFMGKRYPLKKYFTASENEVLNAYMQDQYAKGGETKWIQKAIKKPGSLRAEAKREGLIEGDEKLSKTDLKKLEKKGGKTARRARLAQTLKTL